MYILSAKDLFETKMSAVRLVERENPINSSVVKFEQLLTDYMYIHTYCLTYNIVYPPVFFICTNSPHIIFSI